MALSADVIQWAIRRKISIETLKEAGCESDWGTFSGRQAPCIVFPYFRAGERVNYKARSLIGKEYKAKPGAPQVWYNLDRVLRGKYSEVYVVEGEADCLAMIQAGIPNVLSVPSGAPNQQTENPAEAKRYDFIESGMQDGLSSIKKWILCTDADGPGRHLRSDLAALIGPGKCYWVEWPEGIKDANDALIQWGAGDLHIYVDEGQQEYPIEGLYRLSEIPEPSPLILWNSGFPEWESKFRIAPTCVSVVSGYPGNGKSHFTQQLWQQVALQHNVRVAIMSMETREKPFVRRNLRSAYHRKLEVEMSDSEKREADDFIEEHFIFMHHPKNTPSFSWICDQIANAHARMGISAVSIDPWNMIVQGFDNKSSSETKWIGECLDDCSALAKGLSLHLQILAHPSKPMAGDNSRKPITYDRIAGSQHWANKPDHVWSIHRDKLQDDAGNRVTDATIWVHKARYEELGFPGKFNIKLDLANRCFHSTDYLSH